MIVTGSEVEALHLEQNLVKRHRPPFNVRLRDDKSFPYIAVTVEDEYPRVMFTRERHRHGVWYFGPYANAKKVRETLDVLNRVFRFRPCEGRSRDGIRASRASTTTSIAATRRASATSPPRTTGRSSTASWSSSPATPSRSSASSSAACARRHDEERFEEAARYRNRLFSIQHLAERQAADRRDVGDVDVLGLALEGDRGVVQIFPLRGGKMIDRYSFHLENVDGQDVTTVLEAFCARVLRLAPSVPPQIIVPHEAGDLSALEELLTERRGSRVEVRSALRGEKRRLAELAAENARHALASEQEAVATRRARRVEALEELREALNLESLPLRIECFDISTIQGTETVGSMVVFQDAAAEEGALPQVRRCAASTGQDDFAAMAEVVSRRFARLGKRTGSGLRRVVRAAPNLVVIDGGKGQLRPRSRRCRRSTCRASP